MKIQWNDRELETIEKYGETCSAMAREAMERSKLNFDDIERINNHFEEHSCGSNADRKYRKSAINKAVAIVSANPLQY